MTTAQTPSLLDLFSPQWLQDPYGLYRDLRERTPVFWDELMRTWVILEYDDIAMLSKDQRLSGARIQSFREQLPPAVEAKIRPLTNALSDMMLFNEPPAHTRLRHLVRPLMTPRFIREMRPFIERVADELLDRVVPRGKMDVIGDFSGPLTRAVIARITGIPDHAMHLLDRWQGLLHEFFSQSRAQIPRINELRCIFDERADQRRSGAGTDMFSRIIGDQLHRDHYTDDEVFGNFLLLIDAGQATTTHLIGNAVLALIRNPEQLRLLSDRPELGANAAHELTRYDSSVQFTARVAVTDIDLHDHHIDRDQAVTLVLGSGNRDPHRYADPDRLDLTRKASDNLSLGHGIHYCLGASLAMAETEIALNKLLSRTREMRLVEAEPAWFESINFRFLKQLPVRFEPT
jgi:pimeloyl-[acyl-carrier protein] synthase